MAKLYFYYSAMNAGKTTVLLQSSYNYQEKGMDTLLFTPVIDNRYEIGQIHSRIGLHADALSFDKNFDFFQYTKNQIHSQPTLKCVLIDEAQFLTKKQVTELTHIVDQLNIPILAYGLRSDFRGEPFPGSQYLLIWADNLIEIKTICHCGRKAIMNARVDSNGRTIKTGDQIVIGGNERYISLCRKHFNDLMTS
ncbi:MAG: thymidine kinase [Gammaproteobacteria bacterium RIFCSPHIGHO2_12_FULL_37_14]|nr:MAG: thymidine kinase [Gammaproteobacteria bacterium RIFCSPHIGHO2_12_FULL_37_14]